MNKTATTKTKQWALIATTFIFIATCLGSITASWTHPAPHTIATRSYYTLCYLGQYAFFSALLGLILYSIARICKHPAIHLPINALLAGFFLFFFTTNSLVYSVWRYNINRVLLDLGFGPGSSQVLSASNTTFFLVGGIGVACFIISSLLLWVSWHYSQQIRQSIIKAIMFIALACYVVSQIMTIGLSLAGDMRVLPYSDKVPYFNLYSWFNAMDALGIPLTTTHNKTLMALKNNLPHPTLNHYPTEPLHNQLPSQPLNVLIILVDTWRTDMLAPQYMPYTSAFSQTADQFMNHTSGGNCTAPGVFSLFYGIPPVFWNTSIAHHITPAMLNAFQDNHYQLAIHVSAPITEPPFADNVFANVTNLPKETAGDNVLERDTKITKDMVSFLTQHKKTDPPFFGFLFYDALHSYSAAPQLTTPFAPSAAINYFTLTNHTDPTPFFNRYKNAAAFDDRLINQVLTTLKQQGLLDNTVVIMTGDHGQEYNDFHQSYWEHGDNYAYWQTHTPMIVHWPTHTPHTYHYPTSHFDISTTLLEDVLHVTTPSRAYSVGDNLYHAKATTPVILAGSYVDNALIGKDWIVNLYHDGHYLVTDPNLKILKNNTAPQDAFDHAIAQIKYYENAS